jgi:hypothetical protein
MLKSMLVAVVVTFAAPVAAQVFNPATPTVPSPPPPPVPPAAQPGMNPVPPMMGRSSATDPGAPRPGIGESRPARESHNDRSIRCAHQGAALGVPPGARGQYVRECVNN